MHQPSPPDLRGLRVLAVGTDPRTGPRAIRALKAAGCQVIAADRNGSGALHGRSLASLRVQRHPGPIDAPALMATWVEQAARRLGVDAVLPLSEDATRVLALHDVDLGEARLAGPNRQQYTALCDKGVLGDTAARAGVSHPRTVMVAPGDALDGLPLPAILKTNDSTGVDPMPSGVALVRTEEELHENVAAIHAAGAVAVVQEFVEGDQWSAHIVRGHDGWAGLSAIVTERSPRGAGTPSILVVTPREDVRTQAMRLLDEIDYLGGANVQFIDRDGELFVHDVNLRSPATVIMPIRAGLNVPVLGLAAALGLPWEAPTEFRGVTYLWLESELKEAIRDGDRAATLTRALRMLPRRDTVLDPNMLDPVYLARLGLRAKRKLLKH